VGRWAVKMPTRREGAQNKGLEKFASGRRSFLMSVWLRHKNLECRMMRRRAAVCRAVVCAKEKHASSVLMRCMCARATAWLALWYYCWCC
jgi:hypothetical protein